MQSPEHQTAEAQVGYYAPKDEKTSSKRTLQVVLYFVGITVVFFRAPLMFPLHFHIPYDLDGYHYPLTDFIAWSLREFHQLPWWNPYSYMGQPFYSNIQAAMFYPPTLLVVAIGNLLMGRCPFYLIELELTMHVVVAGVGTYVLLRLMRLSVTSAVAGGTVYCLGAFFASQAQHLGLIACASWLPWVLAALYRLEQQRDLRHSAWVSIALAMMILPGFPAGYLPVFVFGPLFYGSWMWQRNPCWKWGVHRPAVLLLGLSLLLAMALSAVSWLPSYQVAKHSVATLRPFTQAVDGIYPEAVTSFFWPNLFGQLDSQFRPPQENPSFLHLYQGIPALLLVLGAIAWLLRSRKARPFMVAALLALLWMFGRFTFVAELMYLIYPNFVRRGIYPHYLLAYFSVSFAVLPAMVLDSYERQECQTASLSRICGWTAGLAAVIALLFAGIGRLTSAAARTAVSSATLFWVAAALGCCGLLLRSLRNEAAFRPHSISAALCLLFAADLITVGSSNVINTAPGKRQDMPSAIHFLRDKLGPLPSYRADTTGVWESWQTQVPEWRFPSANGMDPLLLLDTVTYREPFSSISGRQFSLTSFQSPLLDLAGVRYIVAPQRTLPGTVPIYRGEVDVYENPSAFPRFFLVGSVVPSPDLAAAVHLIQTRQVDPSRVAVVGSADQTYFSGLAGPATSDELGKVKLLSYTPNELQFHVDTVRPCVLVATETFWKDWHATVDGNPQFLSRANGLFRAVAIPAGSHFVTMFIRPTMLYVGAAISISGSLLTLFFVWWKPRRWGRTEFAS